MLLYFCKVFFLCDYKAKLRHSKPSGMLNQVLIFVRFASDSHNANIGWISFTGGCWYMK